MAREKFLSALLIAEAACGLAFFLALGLGLLDGVLVRLLQAMGVLS